MTNQYKPNNFQHPNNMNPYQEYPDNNRMYNNNNIYYNNPNNNINTGGETMTPSKFRSIGNNIIG